MSVGGEGRSDYTRFDKMDTGFLEALLQADFDAPEAEQLEEEAILYILNIISERRKADPAATKPDVEAAREEFYREYYPLLEENRELLLDFYGEPDETAAGAGDDKDELAPTPEKGHALLRTSLLDKLGGLPKPLRGLVGVAAVLVVMLFGGTVSTYAFGYNPFAAIARWSEEVLWFNKTPVTAELRDEMRKYFEVEDIDRVLPKWLPQGYVFDNVTSKDTPAKIEIRAEYHKETSQKADILYLDYILNKNKLTIFYEKDETEAAIYTVNDIRYYIAYNNENKAIAWQYNGLECYVVGNFSMEEAKKIIDSIYEE